MKTHPLPRSTPESQGIPSAALLALIDGLERNVTEVHSVMVLRHGAVVAEGWWDPYAANEPHELHSLTKSFTSTAIGLAVAEGKLSVDDRLVEMYPKQAPEKISANLAAMRMRHLLSMSTGHEQDVTGPTMGWGDGSDPVRGFLSAPVQRPPGTHFLYNGGASQMLSETIHRLTGQALREYLTPRLFVPLGIEPAAWELSPSGTQTGGWGLSLKTEDIARLGLLYVQRGMFDGQRILPESWVAQASAMQTDNRDGTDSDWHQGYGFQFWLCRHGLFRGDGAFGQFCIIMPQHDAVVAITSGTPDMKSVMDTVWDNLLPAFASGPLPENPQAAEALTKRLAGLALPMVEGEARGKAVVNADGYRLAAKSPTTRPAQDGPPPLPTIAAMTLRQGDGSCMLTLVDEQGASHAIEFGQGRWIKGVSSLGSSQPQPVAGSYAWTAGDTWTGRLWQYRTAYSVTFVCRFGDDGAVDVQIEQNVAFGPTRWPALRGQPISR